MDITKLPGYAIAEPVLALPKDSRPTQEEALAHVNLKLRRSIAAQLGDGATAFDVDVMNVGTIIGVFLALGLKAPGTSQAMLVSDYLAQEMLRPAEDASEEGDVGASDGFRE